MVRDLVVFGAGGHARELAMLAHDAIAAGGRWRLQGFLADDPSAHGTSVGGLPVLGGRAWLAARPAPVDVVVGVGAPAVRRRIVLGLAALPVRFPTLVHPTVVRSDRVAIGDGVVVAAGCVLTVDIALGAHVHVNRCVTIGHDCVVGDWATLAPAAVLSGAVTVGEGSDVGAGATVVQGRTIGAWSVVGAGAVVVHDLPADCTAVGVPARVIKQREPSWHLP